MAKALPEALKTKALALLVENAGNVKRTARQLGLDRTTLIDWRDKSTNPAVWDTIDPEIRRERTERWGTVLDLATEKMGDLLPTANDLDQVTRAAGVASQNYLDHRDGRRNSQVSQNLNITGPVQFVIKQEVLDAI